MLGVTRQAVHELIEREVLTLGADRLLDLEASRAAIAERVRPTAKSAAAVAPPADADAVPAGDATNASTLYVAKAQREVAEARMAELRLQQLERALIDREAAVQAAFTAFRTLRDNLMQTPRRVAGQVLALTSPREVQLLLEDAIRQTLEDFQRKTLAGLAQRMGDQADGDKGGKA